MPDRWVEMETFARIVDAGSLSAAARAMQRSLPAVCRSLALLEGRLDARLLTRTTRRIALTESGAEFYERCKRVLAEVEEAEQAVRARQVEPQGHLSVTAPQMFGRMHVAPLLTRLLTSHPRVSANLLLTDRSVNLIEEGIDLAVRIGQLADSSLIAKRLGTTPRVVCASPAYLQRRGIPAHPSDLEGHACVRFTGLTPGREWSFDDQGTERKVRIESAFSANSVETTILAAEQGMGLVMVLGYQAAAQLAGGSLVRVLRDFEPEPLPVQAVYATGRLLPAKVRAFVELLAQEIPVTLESLEPPSASTIRRRDAGRARKPKGRAGRLR